MPIDSLWGSGSRNTERQKAINVFTAADFLKADPVWIRKNKTVQGLRLCLELQGISCYPLQTTGRRRKQIRHSRTLAREEMCLRKLHAWLSGFVV